MHKPKFFLRGKKAPWYFEIQTDRLIPAGKAERMVINIKKRTCRQMDFAVTADHGVKIKKKTKREINTWTFPENKKTKTKTNLLNMRVTVIPMVVGAFGTIPKGLESRLGELEIRGTIKNFPNYSIVEISQNIYIYIYIYICICQHLHMNRMLHRVIFNGSLIGLNSELSFSLTGCQIAPKLTYSWREANSIHIFTRVLALCEMEITSLRIRT